MSTPLPEHKPWLKTEIVQREHPIMGVDPANPGAPTLVVNPPISMEPSRRIKFIHLATHIHEHLFAVPFLIGGFYNWCRVFNSRIDYWWVHKGSLEKFDIIYIGIAKPEIDTQMLYQIRKEIGWNSKTKLVAHIDYAVELWRDTFNVNQLAAELDQADYLFAGEPAGADAMKCLTGRDVYLIPHPTNTDMLKKIAIPYEARQNAALVLVHRYDNSWVNAHLSIRNLPNNIDTYAVCLDGGLAMIVMPYFKFIRQGGEYGEYIKFAAQAKVILDSYMSIHTYGRSAVDGAALMIPHIGTNMQYLQKILWPNLTVESGQYYKQYELLKELFNNKQFWQEQVDYAKTRVDEYGYSKSREKFLSMINGTGKDLLYN